MIISTLKNDPVLWDTPRISTGWHDEPEYSLHVWNQMTHLTYFLTDLKHVPKVFLSSASWDWSPRISSWMMINQIVRGWYMGELSVMPLTHGWIVLRKLSRNWNFGYRCLHRWQWCKHCFIGKILKNKKEKKKDKGSPKLDNPIYCQSPLLN